MSKEVWRKIVGYEESYEVSSHGRIKSLRYNRTKYPKIMSLVRGKNGYIQISLRKDKLPKKFYVHRLVAITFIKNIKKLKCVNHLNGVKNDNRVENLEWCTHSENNTHSYRELNKKGSYTGKFGKYNIKSKKVLQKTKNGKLVKIWDSFADIQRQTGYNQSSIIRVCRKKQKTAYGFKWDYKIKPKKNE